MSRLLVAAALVVCATLAQATAVPSESRQTTAVQVQSTAVLSASDVQRVTQRARELLLKTDGSMAFKSPTAYVAALASAYAIEQVVLDRVGPEDFTALATAGVAAGFVKKGHFSEKVFPFFIGGGYRLDEFLDAKAVAEVKIHPAVREFANKVYYGQPCELIDPKNLTTTN